MNSIQYKPNLNMCTHNVAITTSHRVDVGGYSQIYVISYCTKCGAILDISSPQNGCIGSNTLHPKHTIDFNSNEPVPLANHTVEMQKYGTSVSIIEELMNNKH